MPPALPSRLVPQLFCQCPSHKRYRIPAGGQGFTGLMNGKGSWRIQPLAHCAAFMGMNMNMHNGAAAEETI
ncbi:hypothetical protein BJ912DRAFT_1052133 [Pholiota molesta]|nr:hypothetical protein BJ912DRAFT_1052133 [Pholiota molesta]